MNEVNGTTWTDWTETMELRDIFHAKFGKDVAKPFCECGKMTSYLVEKADRIAIGRGKYNYTCQKPGVAWMVNNLNFSVLYDEKSESIYLPVKICIDCGARTDAYSEFRQGKKDPPDLRERAMTPTEKDRYCQIFRLKIGDLQKTAQEVTQ